MLSVVLSHASDGLDLCKFIADMRLSVDLVEKDNSGLQRPGESLVCLPDDGEYRLEYDELEMPECSKHLLAIVL